MFNIQTITDAASADVELKHPVTGVSLGATVTLAGPEHPTRKALDFARIRKIRQALQSAGKHQMNEPEEDALEQIDKLAKCTLGWSGIADNGQPIEFSQAAALKLYSDPSLGWLLAQLYTAIDERERFIKACATT